MVRRITPHLVFATFWALVPVGTQIASAQPHLGANGEPVDLVEIAVVGDETVDRPVSFSVPEKISEPHLIVYVPASRAAKRCVLALVNPIRTAGTAVVPIKLVNILNVSVANALIRWVVRRVYRSERTDNTDERVQFLMDETGKTQQAWNIPEEQCAYTLYHPDFDPITGVGMPKAEFLRVLLDRLSPASLADEQGD